MFERALTFLLSLLVFFLGTQGWQPKPHLAPDEIETIALRIAPAFGNLDEMEAQVLTVRPDSLTIETSVVRMRDDTVTETHHFRIAEDDLRTLADALAQSGFYALPDTIETDVLDGHYTGITVRAKDGRIFAAQGLVAETAGPPAFIAAFEAIGALYQQATPLAAEEILEEAPPKDPADAIPLTDLLDEKAAALLADAHINPPTEISVCYLTVAGGRPRATNAPATIAAVVDALQTMSVYPADGWGHTDDELVYVLTWGEEARFSVSFQGGMLMDSRMTLYPIDGFGALYHALPPVL